MLNQQRKILHARKTTRQVILGILIIFPKLLEISVDVIKAFNFSLFPYYIIQFISHMSTPLVSQFISNGISSKLSKAFILSNLFQETKKAFHKRY